MKKVGIFSTIPVEIIYAAGMIPIDLNNIFVGDKKKLDFVDEAESMGFSANTCSWLKGIYGVLQQHQDIRDIVVIGEGDCSQSLVLNEILADEGYNTHTFRYPQDRDKKQLEYNMAKLCDELGTTMSAVRDVYDELRDVRKLVNRIDEMTYADNKVTGLENHIWQVECSDFNGDPALYKRRASEFIAEVTDRRPMMGVPIGYAGVPPIWPAIYEFVETLGARIVYNEIQHEFVMGNGDNIIDAYTDYTYAYDVMGRINRIKEESKKRKLAGLIHYVQSFCYREMADLLFRRHLVMPIIKVEGEKPTKMESRVKLRVDAFCDMLR